MKRSEKGDLAHMFGDCGKICQIRHLSYTFEENSHDGLHLNDSLSQIIHNLKYSFFGHFPSSVIFGRVWGNLFKINVRIR